MDSKNLTIATMSMTAVVLFCALLLSSLWQTNEAYARGMIDRGGDYIVATQQLSADTEVLVIIDGEQARMNLYKLDAGAQRVQLADQIRLDDQLFGTAGAPRERREREQPRGAERERERTPRRAR